MAKSKRHESRHSEALGLSYTYRAGRLTFEDGVMYTAAEAILLSQSGADPDTIRAVHAVKRLVDGELIVPGLTERTGMARMNPLWRRDGIYRPPHMDEMLAWLPMPRTRKAARKRKQDIKPDGEQLDMQISEYPF